MPKISFEYYDGEYDKEIDAFHHKKDITYEADREWLLFTEHEEYIDGKLQTSYCMNSSICSCDSKLLPFAIDKLYQLIKEQKMKG